MVQMGDPTGTGKGGESIWGGKFEDEIKPALRHTSRVSLKGQKSSISKSNKYISGSCFHGQLGA